MICFSSYQTVLSYIIIDHLLFCSWCILYLSFRSSQLACSLKSTDQPDNESLLQIFHKNDGFLHEFDKYLLGKAYFDAKEYSRAAHQLQSCKSPTSVFLYYYSRYMVSIFSKFGIFFKILALKCCLSLVILQMQIGDSNRLN